MSTETDKNGVMHIDGPPCSGFDIADSRDNSKRVRIIYRTLRYSGPTKEMCEEAINDLLNLFTSEMQEIQQSLSDAWFRSLIFWWRHRPEYYHEDGYWVVYARLATTPAIPDHLWEVWETKEGAAHRNVKEVIG